MFGTEDVAASTVCHCRGNNNGRLASAPASTLLLVICCLFVVRSDMVALAFGFVDGAFRRLCGDVGVAQCEDGRGTAADLRNTAGVAKVHTLQMDIVEFMCSVLADVRLLCSCFLAM